MTEHTIELTVNGRTHRIDVPARLSLADLLREELDLTATHLGCEHGVCGACTVLIDGRPARSCLTLAVQANGSDVTTVEGLDADGSLEPLQQAFSERHALQCGFCTPGVLITAYDLLERNPTPSRDELHEALGGVLCRCTGYVNIVEAIEAAGATVGGGAG